VFLPHFFTLFFIRFSILKAVLPQKLPSPTGSGRIQTIRPPRRIASPLDDPPMLATSMDV
jgi:hypothetical protein